MTELVPCKRCHAIPKIVETQGLFYPQCTGFVKKRVNDKNLDKEQKEKQPPRYVTVPCTKWHVHEFPSLTKAAATRNWNEANTKNYIDEEN